MKIFESILTKDLFPNESLINTFSVQNKKLLTDTFNAILANKEIKEKFINDLFSKLESLDQTKLDMSIKQTFQKDSNYSNISDEVKDYLFTVALATTQKPLGKILEYLAQEDVQIPIDFSSLKTIPEDYSNSIEKAVSIISQEIEENTYNTEFPGVNGYLEYLSLNLDRSTVGIANSTSLLLTYIKGDLPAKTNFGAIEGYVYAALILLVLSALASALGPVLYKYGNVIYENGGKSLGDKVYNITGTVFPGFRQTAKRVGDEVLKGMSTPVGVAVSSFVFIYETGNYIQDKIDSSDKEKFKEIGVESFIPFFSSLNKYYSIVRSRRNLLSSTINSIKTNEAIVKSIQEKINELGGASDDNIIAIADELKITIKQNFKAELLKYLESNLNELKSAVPGSSPDFYKNITGDAIVKAQKLSDNITGISWFNRYIDPNDGIQEIILKITEDSLDFDAYTNKENPFAMLAGSLVYISVFDVCISMPEIMMLAFISPYSAFKPFNPTQYKIKTDSLMKIVELPKPIKLEFIERKVEKLSLPDSTGDLCGVYVTIADKNNKLYKTKFADILFETGKSVIASDKDNFVKRFGMLMNSYANLKLIVTGNADVTGKEGSVKEGRGNIPLSGKRAVAILKKLAQDTDLKDKLDVKEDIKIHGKGAAFARNYKNFLNKGMKTSKLVSIESKGDVAKEKEVRKKLADDRRVEIYISFTADDFNKKKANDDFIKEYCELLPNVEKVSSLFELKDNNTIRIKKEMASNFIYKENSITEN